jgi:hypothetical protein
MTGKWAVVTAAVGGLVMLSACSSQPSPNDASCKIFANSYNAYVTASNDFTDSHNADQAGTYRASRDSMPKDFSDAYEKASGDVAVALKDARDSATLMDQAVSTNASDSTVRGAIAALNLAVDDVVKKCDAAGVKLDMAQWKDTSSPEPVPTATVYHFHNP